MIKAPFNFVPLPEHVFFPDWADQVSQDIPFKNGVSGTIHLNIKAETDIFVRNGHKLGNEENEFSHIGKSYFIPATTLKGCFRNALEILSFGKMKKFNQHSFAIRDLNNETYKKLILKNSTHGGWLYLYGDKFYIFDCGEIKDENRISAQCIDEAIGTSVFDVFIKGKIKNKDRNARTKYEKLADALFPRDSAKWKQYRSGELFYAIDGKCLVFTGQPNQRTQKYDETKRKMVWSGKAKEFLFKKPPQKIDIAECIEISSDDIKAFQSIHNASADYIEFWKSKLEKGKPVPVFFQEVEDEKHGKRHYIGLSYMFKYPAETNVGTAINNYYDGVFEREKLSEGPDMADLIFGYSQDGHSIRGRVHIGHSFAQGSPRRGKEKIMIMSSPRPSFYPLYLKWNEKPVTWNDSYGMKIEIAGYKRYPVRNMANGGRDRVQGYTMGKTESSMVPLEKGTVFTGKMMFHNLLPIELGALLYAITLSDPKEKGKPLYHNLGSCKSYGYGKVSITYKLDISDGESKDFHQDFIEYMQKECGNCWSTSDTLRELQTMAGGIPHDKEEIFTYMELSKQVNGEKVNEFVEGKKLYNKGERLGLFTEIIAGKVPKGKQLTISRDNNSPISKNNVKNKTKPQHGRQGSSYNIKIQEQEKGWHLKENENYRGMINSKGILLIYYPDEINPDKTIRCKFSEDAFSKHAETNSNVKFTIVEIIGEESVMIHIDKCKKIENKPQK